MAACRTNNEVATGQRLKIAGVLIPSDENRACENNAKPRTRRRGGFALYFFGAFFSVSPILSIFLTQ